MPSNLVWLPSGGLTRPNTYWWPLEERCPLNPYWLPSGISFKVFLGALGEVGPLTCWVVTPSPDCLQMVAVRNVIPSQNPQLATLKLGDCTSVLMGIVWNTLTMW